MFREKLITTLIWSTGSVAGAMLVDYVFTVLLLHNLQGYTPGITFVIATVVTLPTTYYLVASRLNLRHARDELSAARDAAINANLSKTLFFANMSHELRTPLNAILGFSELLASDIFAAKRVEYAHLIHSSGAHLLDLVNDLLDLSRIEAGKLQLHTDEISMTEVVDECARTVEPRARTARVRLIRSLEPELPDITGDHRAIKQILLNLLTNAIKFTPVGGVVEIFAAMTTTGELAFGVRDEGIGIPEEDQAKVFERFGQARHDVKLVQEGTGLGLPIVKGLAEAHGGRIALESKSGQGTRVTVFLPRDRLVFKQQAALAS
jgi:two-component system cell cycle sensor histidine kinase PleC